MKIQVLLVQKYKEYTSAVLQAWDTIFHHTVLDDVKWFDKW